MLERVTIKLQGHEFIATRAVFEILQKVGKAKNVIEAVFTDPTFKDNFRRTLREHPEFWPAAYELIAAHLIAVQDDTGKEVQPVVTAGEVAAVCNKAVDENGVMREIFDAITALQKLDYPPEDPEKKGQEAPAAAPASPTPGE